MTEFVSVAGRLCLAGALVAAVVAAVAGGRERRSWLRGGLTAGLLLLAVAGALLLAALLRHDFAFDYVVRNTSRDLPPIYCLAAFWAGQEGTVLLWSSLLLATALVLCNGDARASRATGGLAGLTAGMLLLLLLRSPFAGVVDGIPADGQGLNPLLRNPWMVIHPPVLFVGYAWLAVPFCLAMAAVLEGRPDDWLPSGRRWLLAGWWALGAGMMLGAYWAYITLGWGGFWAWDPVENSSLIPWLFATALLHGLILQRRSGAWRRANLVLVTLVWAAVIYGSFLTRSGVLGDFSVHSFGSLGVKVNAVWILLLLAPVVLGAVVVSRAWSHLPAVPVPSALGWVSQAGWLLVGMGGCVLLGTSAPLVSKLFGPGAAVGQGFYNRTEGLLFALGALVLVLDQPPRRTPAAVVTGVVAAAGALLCAMVVQRPEPGWLRPALCGLGALCGVQVAVGLARAAHGLRHGRRAELGAGVTHCGVALLVLGAALSGPGARAARLELAVGQTEAAPVIGSTVTFSSAEQTADGKLALSFAVGGRPLAGRALMYPTHNGLMRHPLLIHQPAGDIYLEPEGLSSSATEEVRLGKGEERQVGQLRVRFEAFELDGHMGGGGGMSIGVRLVVDDGHGPQTVVARYLAGSDATESPVTQVGEWRLKVARIVVGEQERAVVLAVEAPGAKGADRLVVQVTWKPLIWVVWLGTLVALSGGMVSLTDRVANTLSAEQRKEAEET